MSSTADLALTDVLYEVKDQVATITINRPHRLNAFTPHTCRELTVAMEAATADPTVRVVVLTGAGERAFSAGGDVNVENEDSFTGGAAGEANRFDAIMKDFYRAIRESKPVIARIDGYAIGGGHHMAYVCDFTIASDRSTFGQNGPRVASPAEGWFVSYLIQVIGVKRAKEVWMLCRRYTAAQALDWGLANSVVPAEELDAEVRKWCDELIALSPTSLKTIKKSMDDAYAGVREAQDRFNILSQVNAGFWESGEQTEGANAFLEKRPPDFSKWA